MNYDVCGMVNPENLYTADDLADALKVARRTILDAKFPSRYIFKRHYYLGKEVIAYMAKNGKPHNGPGEW